VALLGWEGALKGYTLFFVVALVVLVDLMLRMQCVHTWGQVNEWVQ
jgi:hypothetical protein